MIDAWRGSTPEPALGAGDDHHLGLGPRRPVPGGRQDLAVELRHRGYAVALSFSAGRDHLVDAALEEERLLGQVVVLALEDLVEAADRVLELARTRRRGR